MVISDINSTKSEIKNKYFVSTKKAEILKQIYKLSEQHILLFHFVILHLALVMHFYQFYH